eukprot:Unigene3204_Nuclearia_a/m.9824 Unigene3204_Nuclearia_a/g.9824  ORF Unigene3204_Nuclearia_a/g.9824 Unigene3204_Nuclearia_a/m.9824 type:complete len:547 (+) Unigene3204_Nuclearia_a:2615-4255(+)
MRRACARRAQHLQHVRRQARPLQHRLPLAAAHLVGLHHAHGTAALPVARRRHQRRHRHDAQRRAVRPRRRACECHARPRTRQPSPRTCQSGRRTHELLLERRDLTLGALELLAQLVGRALGPVRLGLRDCRLRLGLGRLKLGVRELARRPLRHGGQQARQLGRGHLGLERDNLGPQRALGGRLERHRRVLALGLGLRPPGQPLVVERDVDHQHVLIRLLGLRNVLGVQQPRHPALGSGQVERQVEVEQRVVARQLVERDLVWQEGVQNCAQHKPVLEAAVKVAHVDERVVCRDLLAPAQQFLLGAGLGRALNQPERAVDLEPRRQLEQQAQQYLLVAGLDVDHVQPVRLEVEPVLEELERQVHVLGPRRLVGRLAVELDLLAGQRLEQQAQRHAVAKVRREVAHLALDARAPQHVVCPAREGLLRALLVQLAGDQRQRRAPCHCSRVCVCVWGVRARSRWRGAAGRPERGPLPRHLGAAQERDPDHLPPGAEPAVVRGAVPQRVHDGHPEARRGAVPRAEGGPERAPRGRGAQHRGRERRRVSGRA